MATRRNTPLAAPADDDPEVDVALESDGEPLRRPRRRGRPPESDGLTEQRILEAARGCFAESGYAGTSTHAVAARADLTTGALYHYFDAKSDLYLAVFRQVEEFIYQRLRAAAESQPTFIAKLEAMLDEVVRLNRADPTLARFMQAVSADLSRHGELRDALELWARRDAFFKEVVAVAVASGELAAADRRMAVETFTAMMAGLVALSELVPGSQGRAVEGFKRLLRGTLVDRVASSS